MFKAIISVFLLIFSSIRSLLVANDIYVPDPRLLNASTQSQDGDSFTLNVFHDIGMDYNKVARASASALSSMGLGSGSGFVGVPIEKYYRSSTSAGQVPGSGTVSQSVQGQDGGSVSEVGSRIVDFYYGLKDYMPVVEPVGNWSRALAAWIAKFFYLLDKGMQYFYVKLFAIMDVSGGQGNFQPDRGNAQGMTLGDWFHAGQQFGTIICVLLLLFYIIGIIFAANSSGFQRIKDITYDLILASFFFSALPTLTDFAANGAQLVAQDALGNGYGKSETSNPDNLADEVFYTNVYDIPHRVFISNPGDVLATVPEDNRIVYQPDSWLYMPRNHDSIFTRSNDGKLGNEGGASGSNGKLGNIASSTSGNSDNVLGNIPNNPITSQQVLINLPAMKPEEQNEWNGLRDLSIVSFLDDYGTDDDDLTQTELDQIWSTMHPDSNSDSSSSSSNSSKGSSKKSRKSKSFASSGSRHKSGSLESDKGYFQQQEDKKESRARRSARRHGSLSSLTIIPNISKALMNTIQPKQLINNTVDTISPVPNVQLNTIIAHASKWFSKPSTHRTNLPDTDTHHSKSSERAYNRRASESEHRAISKYRSEQSHRKAMHKYSDKVQKDCGSTPTGLSGKYGRTFEHNSCAKTKSSNSKERKQGEEESKAQDKNGDNIDDANGSQQQPPKMTDIFEFHIAGEGRSTSIQQLGGFKSSFKVPALADVYGRYKVNWADIYLALIILALVLAAFIMKLISAFFKAMVMYATAGIVIGKSIDSPSKLKYYIRSYFGLFEMLIIDVVMVRLFFIGYMVIQDSTTSIMFNHFPVAANSIVLGIVQAICEVGLLHVALDGVDAISRLLGEPTGAKDGLARSMLALNLGQQTAGLLTRAGATGVGLGASAIGAAGKHVMHGTSKLTGHHKMHQATGKLKSLFGGKSGNGSKSNNNTGLLPHSSKKKQASKAAQSKNTKHKGNPKSKSSGSSSKFKDKANAFKKHPVAKTGHMAGRGMYETGRLGQALAALAGGGNGNFGGSYQGDAMTGSSSDGSESGSSSDSGNNESSDKSENTQNNTQSQSPSSDDDTDDKSDEPSGNDDGSNESSESSESSSSQQSSATSSSSKPSSNGSNNGTHLGNAANHQQNNNGFRKSRNHNANNKKQRRTQTHKPQNPSKSHKNGTNLGNGAKDGQSGTSPEQFQKLMQNSGVTPGNFGGISGHGSSNSSSSESNDSNPSNPAPTKSGQNGPTSSLGNATDSESETPSSDTNDPSTDVPGGVELTDDDGHDTGVEEFMPDTMKADTNRINTSIPDGLDGWVGTGTESHGTYFPTVKEAINQTSNRQQARQYYNNGALANPTYDPHATSGQRKAAEEAAQERSKEAAEHRGHGGIKHDDHPDFRGNN